MISIDKAIDPYSAARTKYGDTKLCAPCGCAHPIEEFTIKDRKSGLLQSKCKAAVRAYGKQWYTKNSDNHIKAVGERKRAAHIDTTAQLDAFLGQYRCADCICSEDLTVVLPESVSNGRTPRRLINRGWSWERLQPVLKQAADAGAVFCDFCARRQVRKP